jgi:Vitamin K-dependent gamma-carboxylase
METKLVVALSAPLSTFLKRTTDNAQWITKKDSSFKLSIFRILWGALMLFSTVRFWALGWIEDHYIQSKVQFKYFGFEWVSLLPPTGMYVLHIAMTISALGILFGAWYPLSALVFFLTFTYAELIDLTYYLNHYYFVSLVSLLLIFVPANCRLSIDVLRRPTLFSETVPRWTILIFQVQVAIVYLYAGLAKINYTWLIEAMPLRIWLPANDALPIVGPLLAWKYMPWVFSWAGMLYDCTIVFWLLWPRTRVVAYISVVVFHVLTGLMFQIGVFPLVMMGATWIFFSDRFFERLVRVVLKVWPQRRKGTNQDATLSFSAFVPLNQAKHETRNTKHILLTLFFIFQLLFPWRYLLYPGNIYWTEEGYRFSWRVMLMEKAGTATFYVKDRATGREGVVNNGDFLCAHQEKQMAMQPDMILQFAHFLKKHYAEHGVSNPAVRAEVYVTLNAKPSRLLIDPNIDLTTIKDGWAHKEWITDY